MIAHLTMFLRPVLGVLLVASLAGCGTIRDARGGPGQRLDPWEKWNRKVFNFNEDVDRTVLRPVATTYTNVVPQQARRGVSNFFNNFADAWSAVNNMLQGKFSLGFEDATRVGANTLFGLFGILDVASEMGLDHHYEDFGQTLGRYGVGAGAYIVLPVLGPSDVRDGAALFVDRMATPPAFFDGTKTEVGLTVLQAINTRAALLGATRVIDDISLDKYTFVRDAYLQRRRSLVFDGDVPDTPDAPDDAASSAGGAAARNLLARYRLRRLLRQPPLRPGPLRRRVRVPLRHAEPIGLLLGRTRSFDRVHARPPLPSVESLDMNTYKITRWLAVTAIACAATVAQAQSDAAPDALIKSVSSGVLDAVKADKTIQAGDVTKVTALVDQKVMPYVDFQRMTSSAVGRYWRQATPDQQKRLQDEFKKLLVRTYSGALSQVSSEQTVELKPMRSSPTDSEVVVRTEIRGKGDPIQLDYRLEKATGGWKIYDVNVLGVWLVENYRNSFAQEIGANGFDGLINKLAERNKALAAKS